MAVVIKCCHTSEVEMSTVHTALITGATRADRLAPKLLRTKPALRCGGRP
jgi:hypothetical protein